MKKNALIITLLAASGFISTSALATDGDITFNGAGEIKESLRRLSQSVTSAKGVLLAIHRMAQLRDLFSITRETTDNAVD